MNGGAVQILYDGDGNRVAKSANGVVTRYLVDDLNPTGYAQVVEELSGSGVVQRQYTYGLQRISENQPISNTWTVSFYGYDGGGSVRQLTNAAGTVTDSYEYDAFGNSFKISGATPNDNLYRGEQYDPDLGLYYLRARYYNPTTGRFISRDPYDGLRWLPATLHRYLYAGGEPVNLTDPSGRDLVEFELRTSEAVPMEKAVDIFGCFAGVLFAGASLDLASADPDWRTAVGAAGATFGCVTLYFPEESANVVVRGILEAAPYVNYAFCGFAIEALIHDLNELSEGKENAAVAVSDAFGTLTGCVGARLGYLMKNPFAAPSIR